MSGRIIFYNRFYEPDESATSQILSDLAGHLAASGLPVRVVTSRLLYTGGDRLCKQETLSGVEVERRWSTGFGRGSLPGRLMDYLTIYASFAWDLLVSTRQSDIVVMKTDPPLLSILGWMFLRIKGYRLVSWCQDLFPEVAEAGFRPRAPVRAAFALLRWARDLSLRGSDMVAILSEDMREYLEGRNIHVPIVVLPNWAIQEDQDSETGVRTLRAEWGLEGKFVIGYSGNLGRAHDWRTVRQAMEKLKDSKDIVFLFIGGGAGYHALQEDLGNVADYPVRFLPYQPREKLASSLRVPDVHWISLLPEMTPFIMPSKFYGILRAGRPVFFVGKTESEMARLVTREGCGRAISCNDAEGFISALEALRTDPALRKEMGYRSVRLSSGSLSRDAALDRWHKAITELPEREA